MLYYNAGAAFLGMGWRKETLEILKKGVEKFPKDKGLNKFLKEVENEMDDPDKGDNLPFFGLILLVALLYQRRKNKELNTLENTYLEIPWTSNLVGVVKSRFKFTTRQAGLADDGLKGSDSDFIVIWDGNRHCSL